MRLRRRTTAYVYLKGGQTVKLKVDRADWEVRRHQGGRISGYSFTHVRPDIGCIDLEEVAAITVDT